MRRTERSLYRSITAKLCELLDGLRKSLRKEPIISPAQ